MTYAVFFFRNLYTAQIKGNIRMKFKIGTCIVMMLSSFIAFSSSSNLSDNNTNDLLHLDWRDTIVSPAVDFYTYANGNWKKITQYQLTMLPGEAFMWLMRKYKILFIRC